MLIKLSILQVRENYFKVFHLYFIQRTIQILSNVSKLFPMMVCVKGKGKQICGGAMVYWIEPLTLDRRVVGSIPVMLSFSKTLFPHCCSPPRCINGYPVGCERYLSLDVACVRPWSSALPECSPGSWGALIRIDINPVTRGNTCLHCKALWVLSHTRKALYKNQLLK